MIPKSWDWGSGRTGIGPLVTLPGNKNVARDEFGYGFAAAVVNTSGKWFYGLLLTQSWRAVDPAALPTGSSDTNPLGLAPFLNYRIGKGWYIGNGDMNANGQRGMFPCFFGGFFSRFVSRRRNARMRRGRVSRGRMTAST